jgi:ankyrin repeat protein
MSVSDDLDEFLDCDEGSAAQRLELWKREIERGVATQTKAALADFERRMLEQLLASRDESGPVHEVGRAPPVVNRLNPNWFRHSGSSLASDADMYDRTPSVCGSALSSPLLDGAGATGSTGAISPRDSSGDESYEDELHPTAPVKNSLQVDSKDPPSSPLLTAIAAEDEEQVKSLLAAAGPEDLAAVDKWGRPPFHLAASRGLEAVCFLFMNHPCIDLNAQAQWGSGTAFHAAAEAGLEEVCFALAGRDEFDAEKVDYEQRTALMAAARAGLESSCATLLDRGVVVRAPSGWAQDSTGRTSLHLAIEAGLSRVARRLLQLGGQVPGCTNDEGQTVLHLAAARRMRQVCLDIIEQVSAKDCSLALDTPDNSGRTVLHIFAAQGWLELGKRLLSAGDKKGDSQSMAQVNVNAEEGNTGRSPFHIAAGASCFEFCEVLAAHRNFDPNVADMDGRTALHVAILKGQSELARRIGRNPNADVNRQDRDGRTSLHLAVKTESPGTALALLSQSDVNLAVADRRGRTVLHEAVAAGFTTVDQRLVNALLEREDCPVNATDAGGRTALHIAARNGSRSLCRLLLRCDADTQVRDVQGATPLSLGREADILDVFETHTGGSRCVLQ